MRMNFYTILIDTYPSQDHSFVQKSDRAGSFKDRKKYVTFHSFKKGGNDTFGLLKYKIKTSKHSSFGVCYKLTLRCLSQYLGKDDQDVKTCSYRHVKNIHHRVSRRFSL